MKEGSKKAVVAALIANAGIAVAKFIGFAITGASSMLAEGVHSVADSGNQALLLLGSARGARKATPEHPFGYGPERYFWAFIVALVIFMLGGVFAIYEGVHKLSDPNPLQSPLIAIGILSVGILLEGWSFWTAIKEAQRYRGQASWWEFIRRTKHAELPVVLLEDLGALVGLVLAVVGISMAMVTGDPRWDAIGSISIGVLLTVIAVVLSIEMRSLLIGEAASPKRIAAIAEVIKGQPQVRALIHMKTMHLGPDQLLVGAKAEFGAGLSFQELADAVNATERAIREAVPEATVIYLEPDVKREAADDAAS